MFLNQLRTAYRVLQSGCVKSRPLSLAYLVTMRCNARCKQCLYWRKVYGPESQARKTLTLEEIDKFSSTMGRLFQAQLSGGEPFIRPDLPEIMQVLGRNCDPLIFTIPTNGSYTERIIPAVGAFCERFPNTMLRINLSIDAIGDRHDAMRNVPGLYERCRETIAKLKDIQPRFPNLTVNIAMVLSHYNRNEAQETARTLYSDFCPDHLNVVYARGDTPEEVAVDVPIEEYERMVSLVYDEIMRANNRQHPLAGMGRALQKELSRRLVTTAQQRRQVMPCAAGVKHIHVMDDGTLLPCDILEGQLRSHPSDALASAAMANLRDFNFSVPDALRSVQARSVVDFIRKGGCWCTSECLLVPNVLLSPRAYPGLAKAVAAQMLADLRHRGNSEHGHENTPVQP